MTSHVQAESLNLSKKTLVDGIVDAETLTASQKINKQYTDGDSISTVCMRNTTDRRYLASLFSRL